MNKRKKNKALEGVPSNVVWAPVPGRALGAQRATEPQRRRGDHCLKTAKKAAIQEEEVSRGRAFAPASGSMALPWAI